MYETLSPAEIKQLKEELMGLPIELFGKIFLIAIGIVLVLLFVGLVGHSINSQKHRKK